MMTAKEFFQLTKDGSLEKVKIFFDSEKNIIQRESVLKALIHLNVDNDLALFDFLLNKLGPISFDNDGIHWIVEKIENNINCMKLFIKHNFGINQQNQPGTTFLHLALRDGNDYERARSSLQERFDLRNEDCEKLDFFSIVKYLHLLTSLKFEISSFLPNLFTILVEFLLKNNCKKELVFSFENFESIDCNIQSIEKTDVKKIKSNIQFLYSLLTSKHKLFWLDDKKYNQIVKLGRKSLNTIYDNFCESIDKITAADNINLKRQEYFSEENRWALTHFFKGFMFLYENGFLDSDSISDSLVGSIKLNLTSPDCFSEEDELLNTVFCAFIELKDNEILDPISYKSTINFRRYYHVKQIYDAAKKGDIAKIQSIKNIYNNLDDQWKDRSAIFFLAKEGDFSAVKLLLNEGASKDQAVYGAALGGHFNFVKAEGIKDFFALAVHYAAQGGHFDSIQALIDLKLELLRDNDEFDGENLADNIMSGAIVGGHFDFVRASLNGRDEAFLNKIAYSAAYYGFFDFAQEIVEKGARQSEAILGVYLGAHFKNVETGLNTLVKIRNLESRKSLALIILASKVKDKFDIEGALDLEKSLGLEGALDSLQARLPRRIFLKKTPMKQLLNKANKIVFLMENRQLLLQEARSWLESKDVRNYFFCNYFLSKLPSTTCLLIASFLLPPNLRLNFNELTKFYHSQRFYILAKEPLLKALENFASSLTAEYSKHAMLIRQSKLFKSTIDQVQDMKVFKQAIKDEKSLPFHGQFFKATEQSKKYEAMLDAHYDHCQRI